MARRRWRDWLWAYLFLVPWALGIIFLYGGPMIASLFIAFTKWDMITRPTWVGPSNFAQMFRDSSFYKALYNTGIYTAASVPLQLAAALLVAMLLNQKVWGMKVYRTVYYLPSVIPTVAATVVWLFIFNHDFGLVNHVLALVHLPQPYWLTDPAWTKTTLVFLSVWTMGQPMVIFLAGLQDVPQPLYDAARVDGAGTVAQFRHVTLPMITPTIFFNLIMGMIAAFQAFTQPYVLSGGSGDPDKSLLFYVMYLFNEAFEFFNMGYASALAWGLFAVILILTLLNFVLARRWVHYEQPGGRW